MLVPAPHFHVARAAASVPYCCEAPSAVATALPHLNPRPPPHPQSRYDAVEDHIAALLKRMGANQSATGDSGARTPLPRPFSTEIPRTCHSFWGYPLTHKRGMRTPTEQAQARPW